MKHHIHILGTFFDTFIAYITNSSKETRNSKRPKYSSSGGFKQHNVHCLMTMISASSVVH